MKMYQLFSQLYISDKSNDKLKENATVGKSDEGRAKGRNFFGVTMKRRKSCGVTMTRRWNREL